REALERFENADEVFLLVRQDFRERGAAALLVFGEDHFADGVNAVALEEHVLGAREADARRAERDRVFGLLGVVGVRADREARGLRAPLHELIEALEFFRLLR